MQTSYSEQHTSGQQTSGHHTMEDDKNILPKDRVWKIGTYSMGITLIGIGLAFAASLWQAVTAYELLLWLAPIIFIVLGLELMIIHAPRFSRKYKIEYNWLSLFFVGCVGVGALILAAVLSTGVLDEVNEAFNIKDRSIYIEESAELSDQSIEKVVIRSQLGYEVRQQPGINEISLLGTVQYEARDPVKLADQQLLKTKQVGNVLYIFIQNLEYESNHFASSYVRSQLVLNLPDHLEVEE